MEISSLKSLLNSITSFLQLSSFEGIKSEPLQKYYQKIEQILKLLKPILDAIVGAEIASDEMLQRAFAGLLQSVDELREICETWQPLMSKIYLVLQVESLVSKTRIHGFEILESLKSSDHSLPAELSAASLEHCVQKIKHVESEQASVIVGKAIKDHVEGSGATSDSLSEVADSLALKSNQELLIEAVALDKLKENAEQADKIGEVEYIDQMIALVTHMHDLLVMVKQSDTCNPVPIPADFCCPLSLELMADPVIVASGQTYERAFIRKWLDLGLTVCPKTRQTLAHTNLIPNYTVKALIANWCESNNVKLPDPTKSINLNQPSSLLSNAGSVGVRRVNNSGAPDGPLASQVNSSIPSIATQRDRTSSHPRSLSEDSLTEAAVNGTGLDAERVSPGSSGDMSDHSGERSLNSGGLFLMSPSRNGGAGDDERSSQVHNRTNSASSTLSNSNMSQGTAADGSEVASHASACGSDASGELAAERQPAANSSAPQREPDFLSRLETRSRGQAIWRRPSERLIPRIVSSPTVEMRADLLEVETQVKRLVEDLKSGSLDAQRNATAQIRLLAKHNNDNRMVIATCGAISLLVNLLRSEDLTVQENAVTALLNLSINDNNKSAIANANAIEPLIHVLETGSPEAKENSAATLFSLSVIEDLKIKIGRSGAIKPLVDLLGNGTPRGKRDAATALFNLSIHHENKPRIVQAGAVKYLVELMDPAFGMVDKAVAVLSNLATIHEGRAAIGQEGGIPFLVEVVELGSARAIDFAIWFSRKAPFPHWPHCHRLGHQEPEKKLSNFLASSETNAMVMPPGADFVNELPGAVAYIGTENLYSRV
ncbi:UNVERIFIED_CONTAM: U-box domain-containing protein 4 [Sesamum latifolium]|uniref:RING-type E3 ubiquitin transferase n=1 Tax=Sesamum latifolium TaxID=2727402 RepID=A0AAW2SMM7_9LAMI